MKNNSKDIGQHDISVVDKIKDMFVSATQSVKDNLDVLVEQTAQLFAHGMRTPVLRKPDEVGLKYEDVFFPSMDGVPLEAWFIPADSDKLIIANHPLPCNRYGFPGHLAPWNALTFGGFEVNFLPELKHLHDAGYNILTYDMRNHGRSGMGNGGIVGIGLLEYRDVIGSLRYVKSHNVLSTMKLGLLSRCMGGNSTIIGMYHHPEEFQDVRTVVLVQPVSARTFIEKAGENVFLDGKATAERVDERLQKLTGFHIDELTPIPYAKAVKVPTLQVQLRRDFTINTSDSQEIFDNLGASEKELFWIEGSNQRFYAYNYFGQEPDKLLNWFAKYV